jgi:hypothetical protein
MATYAKVTLTVEVDDEITAYYFPYVLDASFDWFRDNFYSDSLKFKFSGEALIDLNSDSDRYMYVSTTIKKDSIPGVY